MISKKHEQLMAEILDLFAQRFDKHAVLRGGMVLRMLGCERLTNDLDYIFVPYRSKKEITKDILAVLQSLPGVELEHSLNSKCLRVMIRRQNTAVQVEAKTAMQIEAEPISTSSISRSFNLPPRIIRVVSYPVALSDKMAAWNERRLMRDLYDISFFLQMGVVPDFQTLNQRLSKPDFSKQVDQSLQFNGKTISDFFSFISLHANRLSDNEIARELKDYLPPEELTGISMRIRAALVKLTEFHASVPESQNLLKKKQQPKG